MMGIVPTPVVLFISCFLLINASSARDDGEEVSLRLIRHQSDHRVRRDVGESSMPDVLVMQFPLKGENVILRLWRSRYPPVFMVGEDGLREVTGLDDNSTSVYSDPSRGASFMVKKSTDGQFLLDGNLHHQGNQMDMKPVARTKRAAGDDNTHTVMITVPEVVEFEHDGDADSNPEEPNRKVEDRRKRLVPVVQHTVETAFVIDHTDFAAFQTRFPANTLAEIRNYYTYIALTLNNIYASVVVVDPTIDIKVPVTALYIVQSAVNAIVVEADGQLEGGAYLNAFIAWIPNHLPNGDHYMAFTAYDITFNGDGAVGVAEAAQVCTARSVSVVKNGFQSDVPHIAAHELGHTLSAQHDGEGTGIACSSNLQNVMTPSIFVPTQNPATPRNILRFSACSVASFKTYLAGTNCTLAAATSAAVALPFTDFNYVLITDRDRQCQEAIDDSNSSFRDPANICSRGLCEVASTKVQAAQTFQNSIQALVWQPPVTQAPVTQAPVTQAPVTQAPVTQAPVTQAPVTQAPVTQAPTTPAPAPAPAPRPPTGLPRGCTRCVLRTYYICLRYYYYSVWYRYRLSPCCRACIIFWRGYRG